MNKEVNQSAVIGREINDVKSMLAELEHTRDKQTNEFNTKVDSLMKLLGVGNLNEVINVIKSRMSGAILSVTVKQNEYPNRGHRLTDLERDNIDKVLKTNEINKKKGIAHVSSKYIAEKFGVSPPYISFRRHNLGMLTRA